MKTKAIEAIAEPASEPVEETRQERMNRIARARWEASQAAHDAPFAPTREPTELELKLADADARAEAREAIRERIRRHPPAEPTKPPGSGWFWTIPDYDDYQPNDVEIDAEIVDSLSVERKRAEAKAAKRAEKQAAKKAGAKVDPTLTAFAREMRDRWLESSHAILPGPAKHALVRQIETTAPAQLPLAA